MALFVVVFVISVVEQVVSGFDHFDGRSVVEGLALFFAELGTVFVLYFAFPAVAGVLSVLALLWIGAYVSVRWEERRRHPR